MMLLRYSLLGALMESPDYGYKLKTRVPAKVFHDFGINDNQLYPTLKKLHMEGLVEKEVIYQEGSPNRNMYHITDKGRKEFLDWLESSDGEETGFRYEILSKDVFMTRCIYILNLEKQKALKKIDRQIRLVNRTIADFNHALRQMETKKILPIKIKVLEFAIMNQQARLAWLNQFSNFVKTYDEEGR